MLLKALIVSGLAALANAALYKQVVTTKYGPLQGYPALSGNIRGIQNWQDISVWKGIPFAASAGGTNRFKPPQPVQPWNVTRDARDFGPVCAGMRLAMNHTQSEDCLTLNIWSAANSTDAKLPVAIWQYPAGGSSSDSTFDGAGMADKGIVFVNFNRRESIYAWLAHPWLSAEMSENYGTNSSGNWAMLDQQAALKWVYENIAAFGGDPDRITFLGQSAGSAATYHIVNSPLVEGLIKGAIIQSGVRYPKDPLCSSLAENYKTLDTALTTGEAFVAKLNVTSLQELRALSTKDFPEVSFNEGSFSAVLDGYAMPSTYMESLRNGAANDVPIITGNTKDESGASYGLNMTLAEYVSNLNATYDSWASTFQSEYNSTYGAAAAYNAQFTDRSIIGTYLWTRLWYTASSKPVYNYFWDHAPPGTNGGAAHMTEIPYVLNNLYGTDLPYTDEDYEISAIMSSYWANFIKNQDPNGDNLTQWDPVGEDQVVQQVGNGWGPMTLRHVELFSEWFSNLTTVY